MRRFGVAPPQDINELRYWTFDRASVIHRGDLICDDVRCGPNSAMQLSPPISKDTVNVLSPGFKKPVAKEEHGRNAVVGPPLTVEGHGRCSSQFSDVFYGERAKLTAI